ncbi:MAG: FAD-containing oxidoreductase [Chitinivibrionales bacterium]|nr:FAD-containing oxidoreductase [Chitinivibrionales bacterium]
MNETLPLQPHDRFNQELEANTHPPEWKNPSPAPTYNLVVIGGGTAGLVCAAGAAGLGGKVALIEERLMGGDCLNFGCVPSKALIRSSRENADIRSAKEFGIDLSQAPSQNFTAVMDRMRRLRARISPHDSAERFKQLGVDVFLGSGRFTSPDTVQVESSTLTFRKAVIATGARPAALPIEGLAETGYQTNETIFSLTEFPRRFAVIGGGPLGCELAQAFSRLGSSVTILDKAPHLLPREDQEAAELLQKIFAGENIDLKQTVRVSRIEKHNGDKVIRYRKNDTDAEVIVDEILLAAGRAPNIDGLDLEKAEVEYDPRRGVIVDDHLQTTNSSIYAAGDCCSRYKFTHIAEAQARIALQNALFLGRKKMSSLTIPWCTYTDPEIAHTGMYEKDSQGRDIEMDTFKIDLSEIDRAVVDGEEDGFVKIHTVRNSDKILGATIVARHAGEMISELTLAITGNIGLKTIAATIHPYPTQSEIIKHAADAYNRSRLTPGIKKLFSLWLQWRR